MGDERVRLEHRYEPLGGRRRHDLGLRPQDHVGDDRIDLGLVVADCGSIAYWECPPGFSLTEGDLIIGKQNQPAIGTLVERQTGYAMLLHLPDGYKPEQVRDEQ